ncbi:MAG: Gfo/Idh/MocA family oxidoreductase [Bacteroidales bacterium]|nr:Gfo/Idh/MocA family oxidoreductase [Bacteroidales bacterium]
MDIAVLGVGNRARKYLSCLPENVRVSCLVEPEDIRLRQAAARHNVPPENCYSNPDDFFAQQHPGLEAVIIAAPDKLHVPLALSCVERGWHVLLEKPAATSEEQYLMLLNAADNAKVYVGVCLELRLHPFFRRIRELAAELGPISRIDHEEHIGPDRMAHTFVRGLWSQKAATGPIFLSKCCHDADFLLWLTGAKSAGEVHSRGAITRFRSSNAPEGAAGRCVDCPLERECPYSAVDLYSRRGAWTSGFDVPEGQTLADVIDEELRNGRYGRCVYHCDNDVFDTQTVTAVLDDGMRINMHLEGTSMQEGRVTQIIGERGMVLAEGGRVSLLLDGSVVASAEDDYSALNDAPLHAGADAALLRDFFESVACGREPVASLRSAYPGHQLCFLAGH